MDVYKYLESKGIKDNPRIIDATGQSTDFYLQTLLEDFKEQLILHGVVEQSKQLCQHKYQDIRYGTSRCVICGEEEQILYKGFY